MAIRFQYQLAKNLPALGKTLVPLNIVDVAGASGFPF